MQNPVLMPAFTYKHTVYSKVTRTVLSFLLLMVFSQSVKGQKYWYADFTPGVSYTPPAPLFIHQENHKNLFIWAKYKSEPLKLPIYYSGRIGFNFNKLAYEFEMNHLKVYMTNLSRDVGRFNITHGYNQLFVNRKKEMGKFKQKFGVGLVLAHPENRIRGLNLDEKKGILGKGYYLAGPAFQYALCREISITDNLYFLFEGKCSLGYAIIPVANGKAHAPVLGFHFLFGVGVKTINCHFLQ